MAFGEGLGTALPVWAVQSKAAAVKMRRVDIVISDVLVKIMDNRLRL